uniref:UDP-N-acetylglucosamine diphosphorylase n=1 Tax=Henneguya salminicola TaxID=69463 RepID=A0A6G3MJF0_HENSL
MAKSKYGFSPPIPWYIMTSDATNNQAFNFFTENNFFGLSKYNVIFFEQKVLPCLSFDGNIIMCDKNKIAYSPNGNGGLFDVLKDLNILDDMRARGLSYFHIYGVDNILVRVGDPYFIGYCVLKKYDCGLKVIEKKDPNESVGIVCQIDGKNQVLQHELSIDC